MDEWRVRLRDVVAAWNLSPEEQSGIVDELEQHLEQELVELRTRIGDAAARDRIMEQVDDPELRRTSIPLRHRPPATVQAERDRTGGLAGVVRDVRYGWRALRSSPGTTIMATTALALGIGLTTVMFSIIYGTLLRGLPYAGSDRITVVMRTPASNGMDEGLPMHEFFAFRQTQKSFESFGAYLPITVNLSGDGRPDRIQASRVTAAALSVPHVRPSLGRAFLSSDENPTGELVTILSQSLWRERYAADSGVIGRTVRINGQPATVVGVMPEGFAFPNETRLWVPLRLDPGATLWGAGPSLNGVGRLRPGITVDQANAELAAIASRITADHPRPNGDAHAVAQPFVRAVIRSQVYRLLYAMFAAVGLVFLVACTNVANLLLARATHRAKEVAVRRALGASRVAIARQFLVEALVLSTVAASLGAVVAQAGITAFRWLTVGQLPSWTDIRLHWQVFLFIGVAALIGSLVSGLLPAVTASGGDLTDVMKDQAFGSSSRRSGRLSRGLVVFELVLSSALLVVAALVTKSVLNLRAIQPGFRTEGVMTGRVTLSGRGADRQAAFFQRLEAEIARLPGAVATSLSTDLPGAGWGRRSIEVAGRAYARSQDHPSVRHLAVTPGFFKAYDVAIMRGRPIATDDRVGSNPVAVVNQRFVDENLRGSDPLGQRVNLSADDSVAQWVTIVGVMPPLYAASLRDPWPPEVITAFYQEPHSSASVTIRTADNPAAVAKPLRALVASLDSDLPVYALSSMRDVLAEPTWPMRVFGGLFVVFGIVALALASIGLYAVLAFSVSRREREMGIRMALGAAAGDVIRLVLVDGAVQLAIGVSIGVAMGIGLARLARAALFGVQPNDPSMIAIVIGTLAVAGFAASVVPAVRATRADPVRSLRSE
jgi:putative ABC transport system permease protein